MRIRLLTLTSLLLLAVLAFGLTACNSAAPATTAPTTAPSNTPTTAPTVPPTAAPSNTPTAAPTVPPTAAPTSAPTTAAAGYDGEWQGTNADGRPVSFTVQDNQITYMLLNYSYQAGDCGGGGTAAKSVENAPITGDHFTASFTDSDGGVFTLVGKFSSATQAAGTFEFKGKVCSSVDADSHDTWTTVNTSVAGQQATPAALAPTTAATPSNPLAAAVARVGTAPSVRLHNAFTGDAALMSAFYGMPTNAAAASTVEDAEFSGEDFHSVSTGIAAMLMGDSNTLEMAGFGGKSYVHGPDSMLQAPENKWYQLPPSTSMSTTPPSEMLGKLGPAVNGWSDLTKSSTGQTVDGQACDIYAGDKAAATKAFQVTLNNPSASGAPTIDDGSMTAAVCPDGYLHDLTLTLTVHKDAQKGEIKFNLHLSDFGKVTVQAPKDFVVLTDSSGPTPEPTSDTAESTPEPTEVRPTSAAESTPEPTETQAADQNPGDPKALVQAFFDDVNANKLDEAAALLGDSSIVTIGGHTYMSADDVTQFLQGQVAKGIRYHMSNASAIGPIVKFNIQYGSTSGAGSAITEDTTITILTLP